MSNEYLTTSIIERPSIGRKRLTSAHLSFSPPLRSGVKDRRRKMAAVVLLLCFLK